MTYKQALTSPVGSEQNESNIPQDFPPLPSAKQQQVGDSENRLAHFRRLNVSSEKDSQVAIQKAAKAPVFVPKSTPTTTPLSQPNPPSSSQTSFPPLQLEERTSQDCSGSVASRPSSPRSRSSTPSSDITSTTIGSISMNDVQQTPSHPTSISAQSLLSRAGIVPSTSASQPNTTPASLFNADLDAQILAPQLGQMIGVDMVGSQLPPTTLNNQPALSLPMTTALQPQQMNNVLPNSTTVPFNASAPANQFQPVNRFPQQPTLPPLQKQHQPLPHYAHFHQNRPQHQHFHHPPPPQPFHRSNSIPPQVQRFPQHPAQSPMPQFPPTPQFHQPPQFQQPPQPQFQQPYQPQHPPQPQLYNNPPSWQNMPMQSSFSPFNPNHNSLGRPPMHGMA